MGEKMTTITPIRVLVCDDHPVVREGIAAMLETQSDLEVIGEVSDGSEAVARVARGGVDIVLMDLQMAQMDGAEATRRIGALTEPARVIVLTAFDTDERILEAVQAGAQGYLLKGAPRDDIFNAVRVVHGGGSLLQPNITNSLLRALSGASKAGATTPTVGPDIEQLTEREREVLVLIAKGLRNKEIADKLFISERTVKFHANALYQKLDVTSRTEAVSFALLHHLITLDETTTA
jgi:DNA-binding NarL/FixJ family response regulator